MTFAAVGSLIQFQNVGSFSLTPGGIGDLILVEAVSQTAYVTGLSSSNVTWTQMGSNFTGTAAGASLFCNVWAGKVTSTSAQTVTISGGNSLHQDIIGFEYSSTIGGWALDVQGNLDAATNAYPSLTPGHGAGELYFGFSVNSGSAVAGTTSGYVYAIDGASNGLCYDVNCTSSTQSPTWGAADNAGKTGIAVLVYETLPSGGGSYGGGPTNVRFRNRVRGRWPYRDSWAPLPSFIQPYSVAEVEAVTAPRRAPVARKAFASVIVPIVAAATPIAVAPTHAAPKPKPPAHQQQGVLRQGEIYPSPLPWTVTFLQAKRAPHAAKGSEVTWYSKAPQPSPLPWTTTFLPARRAPRQPGRSSGTFYISHAPQPSPLPWTRIYVQAKRPPRPVVIRRPAFASTAKPTSFAATFVSVRAKIVFRPQRTAFGRGIQVTVAAATPIAVPFTVAKGARLYPRRPVRAVGPLTPGTVPATLTTTPVAYRAVLAPRRPIQSKGTFRQPIVLATVAPTVYSIKSVTAVRVPTAARRVQRPFAPASAPARIVVVFVKSQRSAQARKFHRGFSPVTAPAARIIAVPYVRAVRPPQARKVQIVNKRGTFVAPVPITPARVVASLTQHFIRRAIGFIRSGFQALPPGTNVIGSNTVTDVPVFSATLLNEQSGGAILSNTANGTATLNNRAVGGGTTSNSPVGSNSVVNFD